MSDEPDASVPQPFEPPSPEELAQWLPQYQMEGFIAQGGMGAVYLARQPALDRHVAIKVLPPISGGDMDFAARFQIEARAMAKLQHSNIVSVYDFGVTQHGLLYLVMEYVHGHTLHEFIQSGTVTMQHALSYALQLCDGLQYAHEHGIIHRDIKPANVLINTEGRVKVADFGLSRPTAAHDQEIMMGTPDYAAPEISQGLTVDHRADIYAFGVLIYEMLTGSVPGTGRKPASALVGSDPAWDDVITKATRPLPQERFASVKEMRAAISLAASKRRYAPGAGQHAQHGPKGGGGGSGKGALYGTLAAALVIGGIFFWHRSRQPAAAKSGETPKVAEATSGNPGASGASPATDKPKAPESPPPPPLKIDFVAAQPGHLGRYPLGHKDSIWGVAILPDGKRAVSVASDHTLKVWRIMTGELLRTIKVGLGQPCLAMNTNGRYAAVGGSQQAEVWDIESGELKGKVPAIEKSAFNVAFSPDSSKVICASRGRPEHLESPWHPVEVWTWADGSDPKVLEGWTQPVNDVNFVPGVQDGQFVTVGNSPRTSPDGPLPSELCVGSLDSPKPLRIMTPLKGGPWRVTVSPDRKYVVIMFGNVPTLYDFQSLKEVVRCLGHSNRVDTMKFLDGSRLLLTGCEDKSLRIWETATGKELWRAALDEAHGTNCFDVSADETLVLSGGGWSAGQAGQPGTKDDDFRLHLWKLPPLASLHTTEGDSTATKNDLANLPAVDPDLAKLKSQVDAEWDAKMVKESATARDDLDSRYVAALQRTLGATTPSERPAFLDEISRVANKGPVPKEPPAGASPVLQRLIKAYIDQIAQLKLKSADSVQTVLQQNESRFTAMETLRRAQGDNIGAARVKRVWSQWSKDHNKIR